MKIYLASKSPRRRELLTMMGIDFDIFPVDTPELIAPNETPEHYSARVTQEKLDAAWIKLIKDHKIPRPILCADTEVVLDDTILGKPSSYQNAFDMIKSYSGRSHRVITSVGLRYLDHQKIIMNSTTVTFAVMSDKDIHHYLEMNDYCDKAGGYGIQSYIGQFITSINGCFYSVMGLPLNAVHELLADFSSDCGS
jgi:septum formation protein